MLKMKTRIKVGSRTSVKGYFCTNFKCFAKLKSKMRNIRMPKIPFLLK